MTTEVDDVTHRLFDAHLHIIDPAFPLVGNAGFVPDPFDAQQYLARVGRLPADLAGGAVVAGSFQGTDPAPIVAAIRDLAARTPNADGIVGVIEYSPSLTDQDLQDLDHAGVRAMRFNVFRSSVDRSVIDSTARRIHEVVGWHTEFYLGAASVVELSPLIRTLPAACVDHLGMADDRDTTAVDHLLTLAESGVRVKVTGFGRVDIDVTKRVRALFDANPDTPMFGTDLPSTRAPRPFNDQDLDVILEAFDDEECDRILYRNAVALYRPRRDMLSLHRRFKQ